VNESADDLAALQQLLDRSFASASEHLKSIMSEPRRLTAERLAADVPSPAVLNIATVSARGEPRISAVDGHFLRGHWYFTTAEDSPKARQLRAQPAISASYTPRDGYGVFCHGRAVELEPGPERQMVIDHFVQTYGQSPEEWGTAIYYARIDAAWLVGFAMTDEEMAAIEAERAARQASQ
jgi:nitroimidazol reductase NimA-like FMN-containing flavoprotein (pyridoxamine 5'-phosphate oxidase superfamily)